MSDLTIQMPDGLALEAYLHEAGRSAIVLSHGAGSNFRAPFLVSVAEAFARAGVSALRFNLPFRQLRPHGPPSPGGSKRDREGIERAIAHIRVSGFFPVFAGGHSYGGRQTTMLVSEQPALADALLLLSYPLHAPGRESHPRVAHFPALNTPCFFVHGSKDPFGSLEEMRSAIKLIPAQAQLYEIEGAGHDLKGAKPDEIVRGFLAALPGWASE